MLVPASRRSGSAPTVGLGACQWVRAFTIPLTRRHRQHDDGSLPARVSSAPLPVPSCACTSAPPGRRRRLETPESVESGVTVPSLGCARGSSQIGAKSPGPTELPAGPRCPLPVASGGSPRCGTCLPVAASGCQWRLPVGRPTGKLVNHRPVARGDRPLRPGPDARQPGSTSGRVTAAAVSVASMANPTQAGEDTIV